MRGMRAHKDVSSYIKAAPKEAQTKLKEMRSVIRKAVPQAQEVISYGIPTYKLNGNLVHFGAFKDHIGFFPTASGVAAFKKELGARAASKGSIHFSLDKPLPIGLIRKIVAFRVKKKLNKKV